MTVFNTADALRLGSTAVDKVYLGADAVWSATLSYEEETLDDSPLGYWRLNETSGTVAADSSGNARTGTYAGTPTFASGATTFSGDDRVTVPATGLDAGTTGFTIKTRIKGTKSSGTGTIAARWHDGGAQRWVLSLYQGTGTMQAWFKGGGGYPTCTNATDVLDGEWHEVALRYTGSGFCIVVDGVAGATTSYTGNPGDESPGLAVGAKGSGSEWLNATQCEVALFGSGLTNERLAVYTTAPGPSGGS